MSLALNNTLSLRTYAKESCTHTHAYYQWVLPVKGSLDLQIGHRLDVVNEDKAALVGVHESHCFSSNNDNLFLILNVHPEKTWMNKTNLLPFWNLSSDLKKFLTFAHSYMAAEQSENACSILADFLEKLLMQQFLSHLDPIILKAMTWIDKHFADAIDLRRLANHCFLSSSQLQRRFKRITDQGVGEYWRMKKLQQGKQLLGISRLSVEVIAEMVGYESVASFSRSFSQKFSLSPAHWRNMLFSAKNMRLEDKESEIN